MPALRKREKCDGITTSDEMRSEIIFCRLFDDWNGMPSRNLFTQCCTYWHCAYILCICAINQVNRKSKTKKGQWKNVHISLCLFSCISSWSSERTVLNDVKRDYSHYSAHQIFKQFVIIANEFLFWRHQTAQIGQTTANCKPADLFALKSFFINRIMCARFSHSQNASSLHFCATNRRLRKTREKNMR